MKVAIIGAGPAGLTAAYQLSKEVGIDIDVFEKSDSIGGLSKTIQLWGHQVDLGPHRFFSSDTRVNSLWLELVGKDYQMVNRLTRIYYNDRFFHYPLSPWNALRNLGFIEAILCLWSYLVEVFYPTPQKGDFESWVIKRFGKRLYGIFFKTYSEKLWGISCKELDADFAAQRIKKLSLYEAIKNAFFNNGDQQHKTLVDQFAYPDKGTGMVYNRMKTSIEQTGGKVHLRTPVKRVLFENGKVYGLELEGGQQHHYDHIVSTMPLSLLVQQMKGIPQNIVDLAGKLSFRNTLLVYLHIDAEDLFPDNWLYIHSDILKMGRVTNFRNWIPQIYENQSGTVLSIEYWCDFEDELWNENHDKIIALATRELQESNLIQNHKVLSGKVVPIPRCYPVYKKGYKKTLQPIEEALNKIDGISVIGRYGAFKYNNQDHSILMGLLTAENIINGRNHNLWEINTDYDTYQERSIITDTGLVNH